MFERFTHDARAVVISAQAEASRRGDHLIGTQHLLLGLLRDPGPLRNLLVGLGLDTAAVDRAIDALAGAASNADANADADADALAALGIDLERVRLAVEGTFGAGALHRAALSLEERRRPGRWPRIRRRHRTTPTGSGHHPFNPRATTVLELSLREAIRLGHNHIGSEHIALGLLREGHGLACRILCDAGLDLAALRREVEALTRAQPRS